MGNLCGLPKGVKGMKDHLPACEETMLSSFCEYHEGKCISRVSGWPWCVKGGSGGCLRAEDSRAGTSGVVVGGEPTAGLTGRELLAAGSDSQTSGWILLAVPNPSGLWSFWMYWLEEDWLQRCPDALHRMACPSGSLGALLEHCTVTEHMWVMGTCVRVVLLALSLLGQLARFVGEWALVGWC